MFYSRFLYEHSFICLIVLYHACIEMSICFRKKRNRYLVTGNGNLWNISVPNDFLVFSIFYKYCDCFRPHGFAELVYTTGFLKTVACLKKGFEVSCQAGRFAGDVDDVVLPRRKESSAVLWDGFRLLADPERSHPVSPSDHRGL